MRQTDSETDRETVRQRDSETERQSQLYYLVTSGGNLPGPDDLPDVHCVFQDLAVGLRRCLPTAARR